MSSFTPHSKRFKLSPRPLQSVPVKPLYTGQHATVNCHACNRTMVPRVVSYYGQPLRSICPFCGTTFMKFPSGLQRLIKRFQTHRLSFVPFQWLTLVTLGLGLLWFVSAWAKLPANLFLFAVFGTIGFGLMALAELFAQCLERVATRFSHQSNYYWAALVIVAYVTANLRHELTFYLILFFLVLLVRWFIVGSMRAMSSSRLPSD
jgi:hypothetical protein